MKVVKGRGYAILNCDVLEGLAHLSDNSVQCVVTSPPYYGLRAYGTNPQVWDGDPECEHEWGSELPCHYPGQVEQSKWKTAEIAGKGQTAGSGQYCQRCGAWKGELGLEPTPSLYVQHMVQVFREVRRVLRADGTLWLNIGDSFYGGKGRNGNSKARRSAAERGYQQSKGTMLIETGPLDMPIEGLKPKDLIGIPWMLAFALREDGWWLRQDLIWHKPNPMPESVTDRCTKAHEYVFLMSKSAKYYYDHEAVKEDGVIPAGTKAAKGSAERFATDGVNSRPPEYKIYDGLRNKRSVWTVSTKPFKGAHFATFPPALVEPMILAGTSEHGCCSECGAPFRRVVMSKLDISALPPTDPITRNETLLTPEDSALVLWLEAHGGEYRVSRDGDKHTELWTEGVITGGRAGQIQNKGYSLFYWGVESQTTAWAPSCSCSTGETRPCVVLDPFNGAATSGLVALRHGRRYLGIELNPEYVEISRKRLEESLPELDIPGE